jgi:NAD(P)H-hydrate epimerase
MKVSTVDQMRGLDSAAAGKYGVDHHLLMENAGHSAYYVILREMGVRGRRFVVVAGVGNNGGDALVVARKLHSSGGSVRAFVVGDPSGYAGPALQNYEIASKIGIKLSTITGEAQLEELRSSLAWCDAVVDGLFGTGLSRDIAGIHRSVIDEINAAGRTVFSVDIPSGIGGNDGRVYGAAVRATYTITFGLPKLGNVLYPGYYYGGKLFVSHISFPPELQDSPDIRTELNEPPELPWRPPWGHKGTFGKLLAVAGARNYYGAPYFSSLSFLKAGGGYSRLAAPRSVIPFIAARASEVVYLPMDETDSGALASSNVARVLELIDQYEIDVVVLGPGISLDQEAQSLARALAPEVERPLILDGDGLTAISSDPSILRPRGKPTVLTPHPGEMARLLGISIGEVESNRVETARRAAKDLNSYVVLKGAHSIVAYPDGRAFINMSGNSGMGTAGSGDVLTGTIAAMIGLGLNVGDAVRAGVFIHGLSGDLAAAAKGEDGITAEDVLQWLPAATKAMREDHDGVVRRYMPEVI